MHITFVIPVYNERDTLEALADGISEHTSEYPHTILFVEDGSTDGSLEVLEKLAERNPAVRVVALRGNFGKSTALAAGFARADGDLVFTMDSDLQDDPKEIPRFIEKLEEGYDVVCGWKAVRHDPWHKTVPSRLYNGFVSWMFDLGIHDVNCGYKLFRREVVQCLQVYGEMHRLLPVQAHHLNFRVTEIPVVHHKRRYGRSKFGLERFFRGAVDVLTMWFLTRYRFQPAHFFGLLSLLEIAAGGLAGVASVAAAVRGMGNGWPAAGLVASVLLVAAGLVTGGLGLFAEFVLYHFVRLNPDLYVAQDDNGGKSEENNG